MKSKREAESESDRELEKIKRRSRGIVDNINRTIAYLEFYSKGNPDYARRAYSSQMAMIDTLLNLGLISSGEALMLIHDLSDAVEKILRESDRDSSERKLS